MINKAIQGAKYLFITNIITKIIETLLNILVIRKIDQNVYGLILHFLVFNNLVLFYQKTCLKSCYQKRDQNEKINQQIILKSALNLMTFGVIVTFAIDLILYIIYAFFYGHLHQDFELTMVLYFVACIIESYCEVLIVEDILNLEYQKVSKAQSYSIFVKTLSLFLLEFNQSSMVNFGISQLLQQICYFILCKKNQKIFMIEKIDRNQYITTEMKGQMIEISIISIFKLLLQELEKIIVQNLSQPDVIAKYMVISNLGSLVPRLVFAPIEEISFNLFAKFNSQNKINKAFLIYCQVLKFINLLSLIVLIFGLPYMKSIVILILGQNWNEFQFISSFQLYCIYIFSMGINGITEAYLYSTIDEKSMIKFRKYILIQTIFFFFFCYFLVQFGCQGVFIANILSMFVRIIISYTFVFNLNQFQGILIKIQYEKQITRMLFFSFCLNSVISLALNEYIQICFAIGIIYQIIVIGLYNLYRIQKTYGNDLQKLIKSQ